MRLVSCGRSFAVAGGRSADRDWSGAAAAAPAEIEVIPGNPGMTNAGVTLNRGILRHIQAQPVPGSDNDLLVRNGVGALTVHYGDGSSSFKNRPTKVVGSGWNGTRQILASGDVTGDRIPDVLAVDAAGAMRRYNGTAAGGIANGVVVPGTWAYPKLIDPGDVTGDGRPMCTE